VTVLPYGVDIPPAGVPARPPRPPGAPLRCGVIGSILPHKGIHVAVAAFAGVDPARATLAVWGDPAIDPAYTGELTALGAGAFILRGRFAEENKAEIFGAIDLLIVPSLGLESFGLVAREAWLHGVPVLASDRGALGEMLAGSEGRGGALFTAGDPAALRAWIDRLLAEPGLYERWVAALPAVKGADRHAEEVEEVYQRVLARRPSLDRTGAIPVAEPRGRRRRAAG